MYKPQELMRKVKEETDNLLKDKNEDEQVSILSRDIDRLYSKLGIDYRLYRLDESDEFKDVLEEPSFVEDIYKLIGINEKRAVLFGENDPHQIYNRLLHDDHELNNIILRTLLLEKEIYTIKLDDAADKAMNEERPNRIDCNNLIHYLALLKDKYAILELLDKNYMPAMADNANFALCPERSQLMELQQQIAMIEQKLDKVDLFADFEDR